MGGAAQQVRIWRHVLTGLAGQFGVKGEVEVKKVCVDSRLQWGQTKNLWHNAIIRTTLALPLRALRRLTGRTKSGAPNKQVKQTGGDGSRQIDNL
ncbi:MAG: hypothetical protein WBO46_00750 [Caldilineaceae bacterium]